MVMQHKTQRPVQFEITPATRDAVPLQYLRVGAQYTAYSRYNGASTNYDGFGRHAKDNNSLFLYLWGAY